MNPIKQLAQIIYPPRCVICGNFLWKAPFIAGEAQHSICTDCISSFSAIEAPFCNICGMPFDSHQLENHTCEDCLKTKPFFQTAYAPYRYEGPVVEAVHRLKYGQKTFVADSVGPLLAEFVKTRFQNRGPFLIIPVPLHLKRLRERGFNQSLLMARHIAKKLNGELDFFSLIRTKYTISQTTLSKKQRRKNVHSAFHLKTPKAVLKKNILLVDDVATTGNTLNECARVLTSGGAEAVFCVTLAKAVL